MNNKSMQVKTLNLKTDICKINKAAAKVCKFIVIGWIIQIYPNSYCLVSNIYFFILLPTCINAWGNFSFKDGPQLILCAT